MVGSRLNPPGPPPVDERDLHGEEQAAGGDIDLAVTVREQPAGETHEDWPFGIADAVGVHQRASHGIRRSLDPERARAVERIRCHLEDGIGLAVELDLVAGGRTGAGSDSVVQKAYRPRNLRRRAACSQQGQQNLPHMRGEMGASDNSFSMNGTIRLLNNRI